MGLDLCAELPRGEFRIVITREGEMEIDAIPERKAELRAFVDATTARCGVEADGHFGFRDDSLPPEEQRTSGFGPGRLMTEEEAALERVTPRRRAAVPRKPSVKFRKSEADIELAARSFRGAVLTLDLKPGALTDAHAQGGWAVFLTGFEGIGMTLRESVEAAI